MSRTYDARRFVAGLLLLGAVGACSVSKPELPVFDVGVYGLLSQKDLDLRFRAKGDTGPKEPIRLVTPCSLNDKSEFACGTGLGVEFLTGQDLGPVQGGLILKMSTEPSSQNDRLAQQLTHGAALLHLRWRFTDAWYIGGSTGRYSQSFSRKGDGGREIVSAAADGSGVVLGWQHPANWFVNVSMDRFRVKNFQESMGEGGGTTRSVELQLGYRWR